MWWHENEAAIGHKRFSSPDRSLCVHIKTKLEADAKQIHSEVVSPTCCFRSHWRAS